MNISSKIVNRELMHLLASTEEYLDRWPSIVLNYGIYKIVPIKDHPRLIGNLNIIAIKHIKKEKTK